MKPIFDDLWVLTSSGVVVFDHVVDVQLKSQLFGALMSALNSFAEQLAEGGLSNFELSEKRFIIMKKNEFLFVASTTKKVKEKTVIQQLENIANNFFEKYSDILKNWDQDISVFSDFKEEIESALNANVKKFRKGF
ncbi:MAG: hypothetical protein ACTSQD_04390 [Promethearchaeota archaeon]